MNSTDGKEQTERCPTCKGTDPFWLREVNGQLCGDDWHEKTRSVADELASLRSRLAEAEKERDETQKLVTTIPDDIFAKMLTPPVCGESDTSKSLGLSAERVGGCGQKMPDPREWYRCADCGIPFHKKCLQRHCKSELAATDAGLAAARKALEKIADPFKWLKEHVKEGYEFDPAGLDWPSPSPSQGDYPDLSDLRARNCIYRPFV